MSALAIGQEYELNYPSDGVDYWRRVRIVSLNDDGKVAWVKMAVSPCNSFPVFTSELRPLPTSATVSQGDAQTQEGGR